MAKITISGISTLLSTLASTLSSTLSLASTLTLALLTSCTIQPPLHLPDDGPDVDIKFPKVRLELDVLWEYQLKVDTLTGEIIDSTYNWRDEFYYGWDDDDDKIFGTWNITDPNIFNIRRYYTGDEPYVTHTSVNEHQIEGNTLVTHYNYGYYDILAWNEVKTLDGVQSLHFDETTSLDYVTAYTNQSSTQARYSPRHQYAYYQPEFLFGGYIQGVFISKDPKDYDYYDEVEHVYYKNLDLILDPRTYIYLTQVILRHNKGRVAGIDGTAVLQGMASTTNINTGITGSDEIAVTYSQRMKNNISWNGENVDIIGGRLFTFGLCGMNPNRASRAEARNTGARNYIDLNLTFYNGMDSTVVFDVTDQIEKRYKGGIITVVLDVDTLKIPSRSGGSAFDAIIEDYDTLTKEFDFKAPRRPATPRISTVSTSSKPLPYKQGSTTTPDTPGTPNAVPKETSTKRPSDM